MIRFLKYFSLFLVGFLWMTGCSTTLNRWLVQNNWVKDDYRYGDLYRLSNLSKFRMPIEKCREASFDNSPKFKKQLFVIGDSFTESERINESDFKNISHYQRFFIGDTSFVGLDSSYRNILIIETVERHFRERFARPYQNVRLGVKKNQSKHTSIFDLNIPYNSERHESILFSADFFMSLKEWKAAINQQIFGRIDEKVKLSKNGDHLLYALDANPSGIHSNFEPVTDSEIQLLVKNLNETFDYYKSLGFDEVFLSIIPNKTTLYGNDLGQYNQLIPKIQSHPKLKVPYIDTYSLFRLEKNLLYDKGDTHWNCRGKQLWINQVNRLINK